MRRAIVVLSVLVGIALLGLSGAALAEEQVVHVAVRADSEHPGLEAFKAMDGNPATIWHAVWFRGVATPLPHEIVVDLGKSREITGFTHLTRPASCKNGNIKDYEVYLSDKPEAKKPLAKGTPVAKGTFENEVGESVVEFDAPVKGRYFRLRALSNINGDPSWAGIGELTLHCKGVKFVGKPWPRETSEGPKGPGSKLTGLSSTEELWIIKDGVLDKKALTPDATKSSDQVYLCEGETVNGLYVTGPNFKGRPNWSRLRTAKSAVGDFEFKVVLSASSARRGWVFPNITITDRGRLSFAQNGGQVLFGASKVALPLKGFSAPLGKNPFDGNLHSVAVTRRGDRISFYYDDRQVNEQPVDADARLHLWFDALFVTCKIKSIKLTAEKLSDDLKTAFRSAAPTQELFVGSGAHPKPVYGEACRYRIPALAVSKKGTILAFAEARRIHGNDVGDIDAVVKRSEDGGKTWGPEIVVWDDGANSVNNPCPLVDHKTGRIWICMGRYVGWPNASQHVAYSDDDGKTWSKPRDITQAIQAGIQPKKKVFIPGPGAGLVMRHEKYAGRLVIPMGFAPLVVYSDDHGETWKGGGWGGSDGGEAKCAELLDGSLLFNGRTGKRKRALSIVTEGGTKNATKTWYADDLPDPSCQGAVIRHSWPKDGKPGILLYSGPGVTTARAQGTLFASYDDGKTWPWKQEYYQGGSGYSDIAVLADGRVAVLFEKDGKSKLGFTILPGPPATPPKE